jgi:hypothetical protein
MRPRPTALVSSLFVLLLGLVLSPLTSVRAGSQAEEPFGPKYESTAVTLGGEPHGLFRGTRIQIDFVHRVRDDVVLFEADCNHFGASVEVKRRRVEVQGQVEGTEIGCSDRRARQDRWLVRFITSDPKWRITEPGHLRLASGTRIITLSR